MGPVMQIKPTAYALPNPPTKDVTLQEGNGKAQQQKKALFSPPVSDGINHARSNFDRATIDNK
jgi:hypothetical protein